MIDIWTDRLMFTFNDYLHTHTHGEVFLTIIYMAPVGITGFRPGILDMASYEMSAFLWKNRIVQTSYNYYYLPIICSFPEESLWVVSASKGALLNIHYYYYY